MFGSIINIYSVHYLGNENCDLTSTKLRDRYTFLLMVHISCDFDTLQKFSFIKSTLD